MDEKIAELEKRIERLENKPCECVLVKTRKPSDKPEDVEHSIFNSVYRAISSCIDYRKANDDTDATRP